LQHNTFIAFQFPIADGNRITYCVSPAGTEKTRESARAPVAGYPAG
jgi:hypothetical protein